LRQVEKLLISILVGLTVTLISGAFPSPFSYMLLGVALRGFPFAWMSQVIYPNAPIKIEYDGFLLDVILWTSVFYIGYYSIYKKRKASSKLKS